ncbi:hypothetical protein [Methylomonas methanica]|uniref:Uncharacterized protein n=1 Tax=Methylomonas methanica (strain DSM 25384 / MC09) TaxID=857087 RepID=G0A789_METMM|nr:hypothetical protein [Methylomonas methanica]AEF99382.1 hypothetical protein Metme_0944 [Methylomonas methanica MC09]
MFFIATQVSSGQSFGETLARFGLTPPAQISALSHAHNAHLRINGRPPAPGTRTVQTVELIVPIDVRLSVAEFRPVINLIDGLRPRPVGESGPPTLTHGVSIRITRNLEAGVGLNWIQTVRKLNNPDSSAPLEFVDVGHNGLPFDEQPPPGQAPRREMSDVPCGPVAPAAGRGVDFTATTTLAVLDRGRIVLAAGKTWGFSIGTARTLPAGVQVRQPRDASAADFANQLRILRAGINQFRQATGGGLNYLLPPRPNTILLP